MTLPLLPKALVASQIEEIINNSTGRDVDIFHIYSTMACPNPLDSLDPITNTSTNSFCSICSGIFWIPLYSGVVWSGHTTWKYDFQNEFETGGRVFIGDVQVKVVYSSEREEIIKKAGTYLVVDDITVDIIKTTQLGNPINRIIIHGKERSED